MDGKKFIFCFGQRGVTLNPTYITYISNRIRLMKGSIGASAHDKDKKTVCGRKAFVNCFLEFVVAKLLNVLISWGTSHLQSLATKEIFSKLAELKDSRDNKN